jgi:hypothetical protein
MTKAIRAAKRRKARLRFDIVLLVLGLEECAQCLPGGMPLVRAKNRVLTFAASCFHLAFQFYDELAYAGLIHRLY